EREQTDVQPRLADHTLQADSGPADKPDLLAVAGLVAQQIDRGVIGEALGHMVLMVVNRPHGEIGIPARALGGGVQPGYTYSLGHTTPPGDSLLLLIA